MVTDQNGNSKEYGFVQFEQEESALKAIDSSNNGLDIHGRKVIVKKFIPKADRLKHKNEIIEKSWTNLYIKNIPDSVRENEFLELVQKHGPVNSWKLEKPKNQQGTLHGFFDFDHHEDAVKAMTELNNLSFNETKIWSGRFKSGQERTSEKQKYSRQLKKTNLYIKFLHDSFTEEKLRNEFTREEFSPIKNVKILTDEKGNSRGVGFVSLTTPEGALTAIKEMKFKTWFIDGDYTKPLYVALHETKEERTKKLQQRFQNLKSSSQRPSNNNLSYIPAPYSFPYAPQPMRSFRPAYYVPNYQIPMPSQRIPPQQRSIRNNTQPGRGRAVPPPTTTRRPYAGDSLPALSLKDLIEFPPEQQRLLLGERLYPIIAKSQPIFAGKITGMLLDSGWKIEDLLGLLADEQKLNARIVEAVTLLNNTEAARSPQTLTIDQLLQYPLDQQKMILGERLYSYVQSYNPEHANKVTGMLLESGWKYEDLLALLQNPQKLHEAVDQAIAALQNVLHN